MSTINEYLHHQVDLIPNGVRTGTAVVAAGVATHNPGLAAASLVAAGFLPAKGQLVQRALRSEALKNAHMRYLQNAGKKALTKSTPAGKALQTGLISQGGNQNGA